MIPNSDCRTLHLVDIENLTGLARPGLADVVACHEAYPSLVGDHDHVVVAFNHGAFSAVAWGWPDARLLMRSGKNGADQALLDVLTHERVEERFGAVVVGSGDGIFTEAVARLGGLGIAVTVVSRPEALSRLLRMAARHVLDLAPSSAAWSRCGEPA